MGDTDTTDTEDTGSDDTGSDGTGLSDTDLEKLEAEREERLDPANRPAGAEIDNSRREFDPVAEEFKYSVDEVDTSPAHANPDQASESDAD